MFMLHIRLTLVLNFVLLLLVLVVLFASLVFSLIVHLSGGILLVNPHILKKLYLSLPCWLCRITNAFCILHLNLFNSNFFLMKRRFSRGRRRGNRSRGRGSYLVARGGIRL